MQYIPGRIEPGDGTDQRPVAVVTDSPEQLHAYVTAAAIGPWVWVCEVADVDGLQLGGVAMLDQEPVGDELRDALMAAALA